MTGKQTLSYHSSEPNVPSTQPTVLAWLVIGGFILFSVVSYLGATSVLRQFFPLVSFAVGVFLYVRYPALYIGFTWWIWILIALIRRLVDLKIGWIDPNPILLTPFFVSLVTFATFVRQMPKSLRLVGGLPFIMATLAVLYGFLVGLVQYEPILVFRVLLDWLTPVLFGFHILVNWRNYPSYRQNTQTVFFWCVFITGLYGVVQYLIAPEWDRFWLIQTKLVTMGSPQPLGIRVWSTMHSPVPFSSVMMAGLLLLLSGRHPLLIPASAAGYLSFLLCTVRAAWGGWVVGVASLLTNLKPKLQMRLVVTMLVMMVSVIPVATLEPFSDVFAQRFDSITDLEKDQSYKDRSQNYDRTLSIALSSALGNGMGATWSIDEEGKLVAVVLDSGILDIFFALGWFGAIPYIGGLILLIYQLYQGSEIRNDSFACASRSISLAMIVQLVFGSMMVSLSGVVLWGFLGMAMAAKNYHKHQIASGMR